MVYQEGTSDSFIISALKRFLKEDRTDPGQQGESDKKEDAEKQDEITPVVKSNICYHPGDDGYEDCQRNVSEAQQHGVFQELRYALLIAGEQREDIYYL